MKKLTDQEIQNLLEQNLSLPADDAANDDDMQAYSLLFDSLKREPATGLPYNFAKSVSTKIQQAKALRQNRKANTYITIAISFAAIIAFGSMALFNYTGTVQMVNALSSYKWIILFTIGSLVAIQIIDQKVLKRNKGLV